MSQADKERYARDRERIRARQAEYKKQHGARWAESRRKSYAASSLKQTKTIYLTMIARCYDARHDAFEYYGGRGITVCERWLDSFDAFVADVGLRPKGLEIDRIDNSGNYEPGNVKWSTHSEQMLNRRLGWNSIPSCDCGSCARCQNREAVKRYREKRRAA